MAFDRVSAPASDRQEFPESLRQEFPELATTFVRGKQDGRFRGWHANGQLEFQGTVAGGVYDGDFLRWNDVGIKVSDMDYDAENGLHTGQWKFWARNGELVLTGQYIGREFVRDSAFRIPEGATPEEIFSPPPATGIEDVPLPTGGEL